VTICSLIGICERCCSISAPMSSPAGSNGRPEKGPATETHEGERGTFVDRQSFIVAGDGNHAVRDSDTGHCARKYSK
jgi:hypothetical protein